jgi:hypothetical protein
VSADRAVCLRCGAPGNKRLKGAQLVPLRGLKKRHVGKARKPQYKHADPAFCKKRIPSPRRTPTSHESFSTEVERQ